MGSGGNKAAGGGGKGEGGSRGLGEGQAGGSTAGGSGQVGQVSGGTSWAGLAKVGVTAGWVGWECNGTNVQLKQLGSGQFQWGQVGNVWATRAMVHQRTQAITITMFWVHMFLPWGLNQPGMNNGSQGPSKSQ